MCGATFIEVVTGVMLAAVHFGTLCGTGLDLGICLDVASLLDVLDLDLLLLGWQYMGLEHNGSVNLLLLGCEYTEFVDNSSVVSVESLDIDIPVEQDILIPGVECVEFGNSCTAVIVDFGGSCMEAH